MTVPILEIGDCPYFRTGPARASFLRRLKNSGRAARRAREGSGTSKPTKGGSVVEFEEVAGAAVEDQGEVIVGRAVEDQPDLFYLPGGGHVGAALE